MKLFLIIVSCCYVHAAETQVQSPEPSSPPPVTSSIFNPRNDRRYGGVPAAVVYDAHAGGMPRYLEPRIRAGVPLDKLMEVASSTRHRIAFDS